jgi:hypothetical protein
MPQLPRSSALQNQALPGAALGGQASVKVVAKDYSGQEAQGEAVSRLGDMVHNIGIKLREQEITTQVGEAHIGLDVELSRAEAAIKADGKLQPGDVQAAWKEKSDAILAKYSEGMTSPMHLRLFQDQATKRIAGGTERMDVDVLRRRHDGMTAGISRAGDRVEELLKDTTVDESHLAEPMAGFSFLVKNARRQGAIDETREAELLGKLDAAHKAALGDRTMAKIDAAVAAQDFRTAQLLYDDENKRLTEQDRSRVRTVLQAGKLQKDALDTSRSMVDQAVDPRTGKVDEARLMKLENGIQDPKLYNQVVQYNNVATGQRKAAYMQVQEGLQDQLMKHVLGGGSVLDAPPSLLARLEPARQASVRAFESYREQEAYMSPGQRAALKQSSALAHSSLLALGSRELLRPFEEWAPSDQKRYADMSTDDKIRMDNTITKLRENGGSETSIDKIMKQAKTRLKIIAPKEWKIGTPKMSEDAKDFMGFLQMQIADESEAVGGARLDDKAMNRVISNAMNSWWDQADKGWFGDKAAPWKNGNVGLVEVMRDGSERGIVSQEAIDAVPPEAWAEMRAQLVREGVDNPNHAEIVSRWNAYVTEAQKPKGVQGDYSSRSRWKTPFNSPGVY